MSETSIPPLPQAVLDYGENKYAGTAMDGVFIWMWEELCRRSDNQIKVVKQERYLGRLTQEERLFALL
ncbi:MAG: hypothetical protein O3B01_27500 [Planctomycetota bacterium]|nr:hypothetical protein [Planctomycetota bacterium]